MQVKKRILLNWWYDRKDLLEPFVKLQDAFEFVLLYHIDPPEEPVPVPFEVIYWKDFATPYDLLQQVAPSEVIFFNIDDGTYQIALREACRQQKVRTTICDHGLRGMVIRNPIKVEYEARKYRPLIFLLSCLNAGNTYLIPLVCRLIYLKLRANSESLSDPAIRRLRWADRYLCYSKINADFFINRDKVDPRRICLIGNPGLDEMFSWKAKSTTQVEPYCLLLDQPFVHSTTDTSHISLDDKNAFLARLAAHCRSKQQKLYVKLHPDDYGQTYYLRQENIEYIEQTDIPALIHQSCGIFGFYSTLMVPALCLKPCLIFKINENPIQDHWVSLGITKQLDFFTFKSADINFDDVCVSDKAREQFVEEYVYKADGKALHRLAHYLNE